MFMSGGWLHLIGNMWLWICGDNVEDRLGHFRFFVFYMEGGLWFLRNGLSVLLHINGCAIEFAACDV